MIQVPRSVKTYVAIVLILGLGLMVFAIVRSPLQTDLTSWLLFAAFIGLTLLTDRYGLHFARGTHVHIDTIPLFAGVLLFSPGQAMLIAAVARLFGRMKQDRQALERLFNLGQTLIYVGLSSLALHVLIATPWQPSGINAWTGLLVASFSMYFLNTGLVAGIVSLNAHVPFARIWAASLSPALIEHLVMFSMGTLTTLVVVIYPWALALVVLPSAVVFVMLDRTLRMEAQHQQLAEQNAGLATYLSKQAEQLREAYKVLEDALDTKNKVLQSIFHKLRQPLNRVNADGLTLRRKFEAGQTQSALADLNALLGTVDVLSRFLNEFVSLQVMERRQLLLEDFSVEALFQDVLEAFEERVTAAQVDIYADYAGDIPALHADRGRLRQMLGHILENAIRFSPPSSQVTLTARQIEADRIQILITDHGPGIAKAHLLRIFDWSAKDEGGTAAQAGRDGLGLAIAKRVAELHSGNIQIESALGQGTTVTVILPAHAPLTGAGAPPRI